MSSTNDLMDIFREKYKEYLDEQTKELLYGNSLDDGYEIPVGLMSNLRPIYVNHQRIARNFRKYGR